MGTSDFSLCIPTTAVTHDILRTLKEFFSVASDNSEVIIVIDGSTGAGMPEGPSFLDERLRVVICKENNGPAFARNLAAKLSKNESLVFVDDDVFVPHDVFEKLVVKSRGKVAVPSVKPTNDMKLASRFFSDYALAPKYKHSRLIPVSACFGMSRADLFHIDGFNESFKKAAGEDTDFFTRLSKVGVQVTHYPEARVFHRNPTNLFQLGRRALRYGFYGYDNLLVSPVFGEKIEFAGPGICLRMALISPLIFALSLIGLVVATLSTEEGPLLKRANRIKFFQRKIYQKFDRSELDYFSRLRISFAARNSLNRLLQMEFRSPWEGVVRIDEDTGRRNSFRYRPLMLFWRINLLIGVLSGVLKNGMMQRFGSELKRDGP